MTTEFLGYPVPVEYSAGLEVDSTWFTVTYDGSTYVALADAVPFTTGSDFDAAQWQAIEGVTATDLSGDSGANLIGIRSSYSGAKLLDLSSMMLGLGVTPEMFGAVGDGVTDDGPALKEMFSVIPVGTKVYGRSSAVYLNKFANGNDSTPVVSVRCQIDFEQCELRGVPTTSEHGQRALLRLASGSEGSIVRIGDMDGMENYGYMVNSSGDNISDDDTTYTVCAAINYGLHVAGVGSLGNLARTKIYARNIRRNLFNIWCTESYHVDIEASVFGSGQVQPLTATDLQTGDGCKVSSCYDCHFNIYGDNNTNSQFSFEPDCNFCTAQVVGGRALTGQMTIYAGCMNCKASYRDGPRAQTNEAGKQSCIALLGDNALETTGVIIDGYITGDHPAGILVRALSGQTVSGFKIDITTANAPNQGVYFYSASDGVIDNFEIKYRRFGDFISGLTDVYFQGPIRRGSMQASFNSTTGLAIYGTGYVDDNGVIWCPVVDIDGARCATPVYRNTAGVSYVEGKVRGATWSDQVLPNNVGSYNYAVSATTAALAFRTRANLSSIVTQSAIVSWTSSSALTYAISGASAGALTFMLVNLPTTASTTSDQVWSNGSVLTKVL